MTEFKSHDTHTQPTESHAHARVKMWHFSVQDFNTKAVLFANHQQCSSIPKYTPQNVVEQHMDGDLWATCVGKG